MAQSRVKIALSLKSKTVTIFFKKNAACVSPTELSCVVDCYGRCKMKIVDTTPLEVLRSFSFDQSARAMLPLTFEAKTSQKIEKTKCFDTKIKKKMLPALRITNDERQR